MTYATLQELFAEVMREGNRTALSEHESREFSQHAANKIMRQVDALRDERRKAYEGYKNLTLA